MRRSRTAAAAPGTQQHRNCQQNVSIHRRTTAAALVLLLLSWIVPSPVLLMAPCCGYSLGGGRTYNGWSACFSRRKIIRRPADHPNNFPRCNIILLGLEKERTDAENDSRSRTFVVTSTPTSKSTKAVVLDMLYRMTMYMADMVDTTTTTPTVVLSSDASTTSSDNNDSQRMDHRFYATSHAVRGTKWHGHCPLRDLGVAWDVTTLLEFWARQQQEPQPGNDSSDDAPPLAAALPRLHRAVKSTLRAYLVELEEAPAGWSNQDASAAAASLQSINSNNNNNNQASKDANSVLVLNSQFLREPSNIAHSGLLLLVVLGAARIEQYNPDPPLATTTTTTTTTTTVVNALTRGILFQQQCSDGAWRIRFQSTTSRDNDDSDATANNIYQGIEFYPGEAMVALMQAVLLEAEHPHDGWDPDTPASIVSAMRRAFHFYSNHYQRNKSTLDTNYHIWQVQAFARFFHFLLQQQQQINNDSFQHDDEDILLVADYVLELCSDIMKSRSWKELMRGRSFFPNLQTVEIACGLEALAEGLGVALAVPQRLDPSSQQQQQQWWWSRIERAVEYLQFVQQQVPPDGVGHGGLGYGGILTLEQRLDVTGHAVSALIKVYGFTERHGLSTGGEAGLPGTLFQYEY